ncbi:hypothetical protein BCR33DRAFT_739380 [Rhizoclosmatium globosum]|uniref:Uncharacterized protein n=1 Tax=Rhizoclosmatium globosum TaxID=329046 RepID=A0A1Y2C471_9FUNG|nr:hypothetical protein BCR33DRAFT_739380 [Rhizoclosmatium globosum]|eukprot:ORY41830.1 hypothetical protein BCR33DRAFT_739380 [Rhizoclosmatium globosum]
MAAPTPAVATISADEQQPIELKKYEETVEQPEQVDGKKKKNQHQLINDKLIQRAAIGVFLRSVSHGVSSGRPLSFQHDLGVGSRTRYPWKCEPFNDYVDRFAKIYDGVNTGQLNAQYQALNAKKMIV